MRVEVQAGALARSPQSIQPDLNGDQFPLLDTSNTSEGLLEQETPHMSNNFFQSAILRSSLIGAYRLYARGQIWRSGPRVFVNSIPKAGTHLVTNELAGHPSLENSALFVRTRHVNRLAKNGEHRIDFQLDEEAFLQRLSTVRKGQFFIGHLAYSEELLRCLDANDVRTLQVIRHPLDMVSSHFHYICGLRRHHLHDYFMNKLATDEERIDVLINGRRSNPAIGSLGEALRKFEGWLTAPGVLTVRFEDLVGARGGGNDDSRTATLRQIFGHLGVDPDAVSYNAHSKKPRSATFRKGQIYSWSDTIDHKLICKVKTQFGEYIARFGYDIPEGRR